MNKKRKVQQVLEKDLESRSEALIDMKIVRMKNITNFLIGKNDYC